MEDADGRGTESKPATEGMRLGVSSWTYPWAIGVPNFPRSASPMDAFGLLERAARLGVGVVQIADNLTVEALSADLVASLGQQARRSGIEIELGTRGLEPPHLTKFLDLARQLGAKLVRTLTHTAASTPDLALAESWIREVLPDFERAGIILALENYEKHTCDEFACLSATLNSPCFGICLDTVNSFGALETPEHVIRRLFPHTVNIHIKEFQISRVPSMMGYSVFGCPAGQGRLNVPRLIELAAQFGRKPNVILEQWPPFTGEIEETVAQEAAWAEIGVRYLKQYVPC